MKFIITDMISKFALFLISLTKYIKDIPYLFRKSLIESRLFLNDQVLKFENLTETNIDLGRQHLENGNISDAILRFRLARLLFDRDNPEIHYYLGWCYFIKGNMELAKENLVKAGKADEVGLQKFLDNIDKAEYVPYEIWSKLREYSLADYNEKYFSTDMYQKSQQLPLNFIEQFMKEVQTLPNNSRILDLGCSTGVVASFLDYKTDANYSITGVDDSDSLIDFVQDLRGERGFVYNKVVKSSIHKIDSALGKSKYDIIISFDSLSFLRDFTKYFKSIHSSLDRGGMLAIMLPSAFQTGWSNQYNSYAFARSDIEKYLSLAKFEIMGIKEWSLHKKGRYFAIYCKKV